MWHTLSVKHITMLLSLFTSSSLLFCHFFWIPQSSYFHSPALSSISPPLFSKETGPNFFEIQIGLKHKHPFYKLQSQFHDMNSVLTECKRGRERGPWEKRKAWNWNSDCRCVFVRQIILTVICQLSMNHHNSSSVAIATVWSCVGRKTHYKFKLRPGAVLQLATGLKICKACWLIGWYET